MSTNPPRTLSDVQATVQDTTRAPGEVLAVARRLLPSITARCLDLVAQGADPAVLAPELARVIQEVDHTPWTAQDTTALALGLAPTPPRALVDVQATGLADPDAIHQNALSQNADAAHDDDANGS